MPVRLGLAVALLCLATTAARATVKKVDVGPDNTLRFVDQESGNSTTTVNVGDTVMWVWQSSGHSTTRTGAGETWDSGIQDAPFTFSHTFTVPGTYAYHCTPHQAFGMTGTVVVQGSPGAATTTTTLPAPSCDPGGLAALREQISTECDCAGTRSHAAYMACVTKRVKGLGTCRRPIRTCAARSTCGRAGFITCCRTTAGGRTTCSIKRRAAACKMPRGGRACVGSQMSCCDACTAAGCAP